MKPERYVLNAGPVSTATLNIPADEKRARQFEIACAMTVTMAGDNLAAAWHQMTVRLNGLQQWQRRSPTHNPDAWDGMDYRVRHTVPVGQGLLVNVQLGGQHVMCRSLVIEADEV
jgi:hypothetical protein